MSTKIVSVRETMLRQKQMIPETRLEQKAQSEQLSNFQAKAQADIDLLEDLRDFAKKRAQLETEYSIALQKLADGHLAKRNWDDLLKPHGDNVTALSSFQLILNEAQILASQHQDISDCLTNDIAEPLKNQIKLKGVRTKKHSELHTKMQESFHTAQHEFEKQNKVYEDLEKVAQIAQSNYSDLEKKHAGRKNSSMRLFAGSKAESEKRVKKAYAKMLHCKTKAQRGRHDHLLGIAGMNEQLNHYYVQDIPHFLNVLDDDFYISITDYCTLYSSVQRKAAESLFQTCDSFDGVFPYISKEYEEEEYLKADLFKSSNPYSFTPVGSDTITSVIVDETSGESLGREAARLVGQKTKARATAAQKQKELDGILGMVNFSKELSDADTSKDTEQELVEIRHAIYSAQWEVAQATVKIDVLAEAGVAIPDEGEVDDQYQQDNYADSTSFQSLDVHEGQICYVLYDYEATEADELTIYEDETLTVVEDADEGWILAMKEDGSQGIIPTSYVEMVKANPSKNTMRRRPSSIVHTSSAQPIVESTSSITPPMPPANSISAPTRPPVPTFGSPAKAAPSYPIAIALYDYDAEGDDELTFAQDDRIEVISQCVGDVNDGWWKGRLNGVEGVFPSILTELE